MISSLVTSRPACFLGQCALRSTLLGGNVGLAWSNLSRISRSTPLEKRNKKGKKKSPISGFDASRSGPVRKFQESVDALGTMAGKGPGGIKRIDHVFRPAQALFVPSHVYVLALPAKRPRFGRNHSFGSECQLRGEQPPVHTCISQDTTCGSNLTLVAIDCAPSG